jgi:hypothetical protein
MNIFVKKQFSFRKPVYFLFFRQWNEFVKIKRSLLCGEDSAEGRNSLDLCPHKSILRK